MTIQFSRDTITLECSRRGCRRTVQVRITRVGDQPQAENALRRLTREANRRGWDMNTDTCPQHQ